LFKERIRVLQFYSSTKKFIQNILQVRSLVGMFWQTKMTSFFETSTALKSKKIQSLSAWKQIEVNKLQDQCLMSQIFPVTTLQNWFILKVHFTTGLNTLTLNYIDYELITSIKLTSFILAEI
jgi:hypothetical protein